MPLEMILTDQAAITATGSPELSPAAVYLASLQSPASQRAMARQLTRLAMLLGYEEYGGITACPWHQLRIHHTTALRAELARAGKASTANLALSALRGVLKSAWQMGLMSAEDYHQATSVKAIKGNAPDAATGRALDQKEINALMAACVADPEPQGRRDAALIALAYVGGLRRAEIVGLDLESVDLAKGMLTVLGKGNKTRTLYIKGGARFALDDWLAWRGREPGPLFIRLTHRGRPSADGRLTAQTVYNILAARAKQAGLESFSPHDMRRTMISDQLDKGTDLTTVAKIAGHANVATTARYDRRGERAKEAAADMLHVPYERR